MERFDDQRVRDLLPLGQRPVIDLVSGVWIDQERRMSLTRPLFWHSPNVSGGDPV